MTSNNEVMKLEICSKVEGLEFCPWFCLWVDGRVSDAGRMYFLPRRGEGVYHAAQSTIDTPELKL